MSETKNEVVPPRNPKLGAGFHAKEPFKGYKIEELDNREKCTKCERSRKFYCYTCHLPMPSTEGKIPKVTLPISIAVVKHQKEIDGKSTAIPAAILASSTLKVHIYPDLPNTEKSILIFPSKTAEDAGDFIERVKSENDGQFPYERVIFVDSTWNQTYKIVHDPKLFNLPHIKLNGFETLFWRFQRRNPITYLATVEAIYHFCTTYHKKCISPEYNGEYDNLLFFYKFMYHKIRRHYGPTNLMSYSERPYLQESE